MFYRYLYTSNLSEWWVKWPIWKEWAKDCLLRQLYNFTKAKIYAYCSIFC